MTDQDNHLRAAFEVGSSLKQAFSGLLAFVGLTYFVGHQYAEAYFRGMGAEWALSLLPLDVLVRWSLPLIYGFAICAFFGVLFSADSKSNEFRTHLKILLPPLIFLIVALVLRFAAWAKADELSLDAVYQFRRIGGLLFLGAGGFTFASLVWEYQMSGNRWSTSTLRSVYFGLFTALYAGPAWVGSADAVRDTHVSTTLLPKITLKDSEPLSWWMVGSFNGHILCASLRPRGGAASFRILSADDLKHISPLKISPSV